MFFGKVRLLQDVGKLHNGQGHSKKNFFKLDVADVFLQVVVDIIHKRVWSYCISVCKTDQRQWEVDGM